MALDPQMKVMLEPSDPFEALSSYAKQRLKAGLSNDEVLAEFEATRAYLREIDNEEWEDAVMDVMDFIWLNKL